MRLRIAMITTVGLLVSGCATVDMTEMSQSVSARAVAPAEANVVQRSADKLYVAFQQKGFVVKASQKNEQSAASILLNGFEVHELSPLDASYADTKPYHSVVLADITYAAQHIQRTSNAAEVYFEMSDVQNSLRDELESLEMALLSSREAASEFEKVLGRDKTEIRALNTKIARLTAVTDKFGYRVRQAAAAELAARRREAS